MAWRWRLSLSLSAPTLAAEEVRRYARAGRPCQATLKAFGAGCDSVLCSMQRGLSPQIGDW
jgi:hypothetical protein